MSLLGGKSIIITGAAGVIGKAAAQVFSEYGASLVLADIDEAGRQVADELAKEGGEAIFVRTDIRSPTDVAQMVQAAVDTYGRLDCAFNNAGVTGEAHRLHESTQEIWEQVLSTNLTGVWLCLKHEITQMLRQGGGAIVNMSSTAGLLGFDFAPVSSYVATKHGIVGLTKQSALEYADDRIRVNAICPGAVLAQPQGNPITAPVEDKLVAKHAMKRRATTREVAEAAAFLCSDRASFLTGLALPVDGGWTAK